MGTLRPYGHPPAPTAPNGDRMGPWLDNLERACGILAVLSDGLNIPILKNVIGVAIEVLKVSQTVRSNRETCCSLARQVAEHVLLLEACRGCSDDDMSEQSRLAYETLLGTLQELRGLMEKLTKRRMVKRVWYSVRDEKRIAECKERLSDSLMAFVAQNHVIQALHRSRMEREMGGLRKQVRSLSAQNVRLQRKIDITALEQRQVIEDRLSGLHTDLKLSSSLQTNEIQKLSANQQSFQVQLTAIVLFAGGVAQA